MFYQVQSCLIKFNHVLSSSIMFDQVQSYLIMFNHLSSILLVFDQVLSCLIKIYHVWSSSIKFFQVISRTFKFYKYWNQKKKDVFFCQIEGWVVQWWWYRALYTTMGQNIEICSKTSLTIMNVWRVFSNRFENCLKCSWEYVYLFSFDYNFTIY